MTLASGCSRIFFDPELWIWDIGSGKVRTKLAGHTTSLWALAFSPDGTILAAGASGATHSLRLWSVPDGKPLHTFTTEAYTSVLTVAFSPDGATLAAGVRLWSCVDGKLLRILEKPEGVVTSVAFSPDGTLLAAALANKECEYGEYSIGSPCCSVEKYNRQPGALLSGT